MATAQKEAWGAHVGSVLAMAGNAVGLVVFALAEIFLFAWVFGMDKGWAEIDHGADIKVPVVFKCIIKYVTPFFLVYVFIMSFSSIWDRLSGAVTWQVWVGRAILLGVFLVTSWFVRVAYVERKRQLDRVAP